MLPPFRVAARASDRTDTRNPRPLSSETRSAGGIPSGDRGHPSQSQNLRRAETLTETRSCSLPEFQGGEIAPNQTVSFVPVKILHPIDRLTEFSQHLVLNGAASQG